VRPRARCAAGIAAALGASLATACSSSSTQVPLAPLEILIASGDGQFGVVNEEVSAPLRVLVRSATTGTPRKGVTILWDVIQGSASIVGVATTVSDSTGSTEIHVQIGATPGEVRIRARAADEPSASVSFQLFGVNRPTLSAVQPTSAAAGETVTLTGTDFSPLSSQNVVLFSGIRGQVTSASQTSLQVVVPECLPAREVGVSVQLGAVPSPDSVSLTIVGGGQLTAMQVGDVLDVGDHEGLTCHGLPGGTGFEYLALAYSASPIGAAQHPFVLTVLSSSTAPAPVGQSWRADGAVLRVTPPSGPQAALDQRLRTLEDSLIRRRAVGGSERTGPARVGPAAVPRVGDRRSFNVLNPSGGFEQVMAEAKYIGTRAAIFVDDEAPPPPSGFDAGDLAALAARFDGVIHPEVTAVFGAASDLDSNERIIILLTPAVNRLTPRNSAGFVGGFFYGIDLLPSNTGSNQGEIFYALVPDPSGIFSDARTKSQVLTAVPAVLAHEFQHMVHFNERVLVRGAGGQEALWLSEALAQMAEEIVARAYDVLSDPTSAGLFRAGAVQRARRYLVGPDTVSVVVTAGQGSIAERGAGFLNMLYLEDQRGPGILGDLTRTTRTGVANVETQTGAAWADLLADWWSATYLDTPGPGSGPLTYPTIDLRGYLGGSLPLEPTPIGSGDERDSGSLLSSSVRYYVVAPPLGGSASVRLGGEAGGPSAPQSAMRLRLIRIS
jgi:hypothetical protein